jgi:hypothetical protein
MTKSADGEGDFGPKCGGNSFVSSAMMISFEAAASTSGWRNQPDVEFMRHSRCDSRCFRINDVGGKLKLSPRCGSEQLRRTRVGSWLGRS